MKKCWNNCFLKKRKKKSNKAINEKELFLKLCSIILPTLLFQKNSRVLKFFLPLPWPRYNLWKVLMIFDCIFSESLLAWVFWVKTQAKTLERILVRKYIFNMSTFFHNWLSCEFKRLTHVWKIESFRLFMHGNLISRILICLK